MMFGKRLAVSSVIALLAVVLLVNAFTVALLYAYSAQLRASRTAAEASGGLSGRIRENLKASLLNVEHNTLTLMVNNTGQTPVVVCYVLLVDCDGRLTPIQVSLRLLPLETRRFEVNFSGSFSHIGLQTERGNFFPVSP
jgi:hypothetical protein